MPDPIENGEGGGDVRATLNECVDILNSLAAVAISGDYNALINKPVPFPPSPTQGGIHGYAQALLITDNQDPPNYQFVDDMGVMTSFDTLTVDGSNPTINPQSHSTQMLTDGSGLTRSATIGNPSGNSLGCQKLVEMDNVAAAGDAVSLDVTNILNWDGSAMSSITFDESGDYLVLEVVGIGGTWRVVEAAAGVALPEI